MTGFESRTADVAEVIHSAHLEGGDVTQAFRDDARDYVDGNIDVRELLDRTRRRYGLGVA
ncbi:hypothetical protein GFD22_05860 [Bifidobacterium avesanii]|uniref:Antitoxin VbhA domain-containing protein n=2 Tax=Bifidobacterium avesanii TaxID=1798157 RepID=A0A7K3TIR9_9BIFI|nr:hypothetical protein [Bifidobacterium avesanii]